MERVGSESLDLERPGGSSRGVDLGSFALLYGYELYDLSKHMISEFPQFRRVGAAEKAVHVGVVGGLAEGRERSKRGTGNSSSPPFPFLLRTSTTSFRPI
jgi:hypothetical protein